MDTAEKNTEQPIYDLRKFQLTKILQNNTRNKSIVLLGTFPDVSENQAIIIFEKQAFRESDVQTEDSKDSKNRDLNDSESSTPRLFNEDLEVRTEFINNIYGNYQCLSSGDLSSIKTTVVYPATEKHIEKYTLCQKYLIRETPALYEQVTLPYITQSQFSLEWVYNILEHRQEVERIVFEDSDPENGFILVPDMKWDGKNIETLYLLAITHKRNIKSLRDLTSDHLPLLRNIRKQSAKAIAERYGLLGTQLRMYFHYQPSFYHLHVHINPLRNDAPGIWCEKSHMLDTVINNLELLSDYYQKATLPFMVFDGSKMLELFEKELHIKPAKRVLETSDEAVVACKKAKLEEIEKSTVIDSELTTANTVVTVTAE